MKSEIFRQKKELSHTEKEKIENAYSIKIRTDSELSGGMRANTRILKTDKGNYIVKIYPRNFSRELIDFQAKVARYLKKHEIPAPKVYPNKQDSKVTQIGDTNCILMEYLPGNPIGKDNPNIVRLSFETLAKTLTALSKFRPNKVYVAPEIKDPLNRQLAELSTEIEDDFAERYKERLIEICDDVETRLKQGNLQKQIIHGDYNKGSLLIYEGKVSGILDFDRVQLLSMGFDFMQCFHDLGVEETEGDVSLEERVNWDKLKRCARHYSNFDPEIRNQLETFPLMYQILGLTDVITTWRETFLDGASKEHYQKTKRPYVRKLEIATTLQDRIIDTLEQGCKN